MKRMHIHVGVDHLDHSVKFYSALFGAQPSKQKEDYAKWMLDDPCVNFAISTTTGKAGVDHFGIQVDSDDDMGALRARLKEADLSLFDEGETVCCYARSDKSWVEDPAGIAWEAYRTMEEAALFSSTANSEADACCVPELDTSQADDFNEKANGCCG